MSAENKTDDKRIVLLRPQTLDDFLVAYAYKHDLATLEEGDVLWVPMRITKRPEPGVTVDESEGRRIDRDDKTKPTTISLAFYPMKGDPSARVRAVFYEPGDFA